MISSQHATEVSIASGLRAMVREGAETIGPAMFKSDFDRAISSASIVRRISERIDRAAVREAGSYSYSTKWYSSRSGVGSGEPVTSEFNSVDGYLDSRTDQDSSRPARHSSTSTGRRLQYEHDAFQPGTLKVTRPERIGRYRPKICLRARVDRLVTVASLAVGSES